MAALVIGASRGIGRQIALTLSANGYKVGVASKTIKESDKLPGTIYSVTEEIEQAGGCGVAVPIQCNVRHPEDIARAVETCISEFKYLDCVVYNAGAIKWDTVANTDLKHFDLLNEVNIRGAYCLVQEVLPIFLQQKSGKILLISPPIYSRFFRGKTPYAITKVGMTILVHGLARELNKTGVSITSLWPATAIESHVTKVMKVDSGLMRKPEIFADACLHILQDHTDKLNGKTLIDEDYLRSIGVSDFTQYRCDPNVEPPRMMPKQFPQLKVEEEEDSSLSKSKI